MVTIQSVPQRVRALLDEVPATAEEAVQVHLVHAGRLAVEQGRGTTAASGGQVFFYDAARPFRLEYPDPFRCPSCRYPNAFSGSTHPDWLRSQAIPWVPGRVSDLCSELSCLAPLKWSRMRAYLTS
ncbi:hypothetical protein IEQ31_29295 [Microbispora camponoti]|uniref:Transcription regulator HTH AraC- type ligand binding domain-containing protein n=2 Tax=Microbispora bryophytorum TaxID=1460882 RepID=A0ABR8LB58_9ACTN|nr:hypothetical protein [Microbispora camponoti]